MPDEAPKFNNLMNTTRVADTTDIQQLVDIAEREDYNRQAAPTALDGVDPNGNHLVLAMMIHDHKHGEACEPHMRVQVMLKLEGDNAVEPRCFTLDVPMENYHALPTAAEVLQSLDN